MQLWQTRLLRFTKLTVADEIENALSYYEATFLQRDTASLYAESWKKNWAKVASSRALLRFLRMGQWIGGDRDGNPNVTARHAGTMRCTASPKWCCVTTSPQVHHLGAASSRYRPCSPTSSSPTMKALAERSPDTNAHRQDEPYRRALTGMYARLAATLKALTGGEAARHAVAPQRPLHQRRRSLSWLTCSTIEASLQAHHGEALATAAPGTR
jgi:phosphoenolpyruvate carboxylase